MEPIKMEIMKNRVWGTITATATSRRLFVRKIMDNGKEKLIPILHRKIDVVFVDGKGKTVEERRFFFKGRTIYDSGLKSLKGTYQTLDGMKKEFLRWEFTLEEFMSLMDTVG